MKKTGRIIVTSACIAVMLGAMPISAAAEGEELIYGTMNIPYADFYKAEIAGSANEYEVDAVSSATTSKWCKNGKGELFEGTYNQANEDGTGTILGVTYPVAITQEALNALGENNYGFTPLDTTPAAYKTVTVAEGKAAFSAVNDAEPISVTDAKVEIGTSTAWGDYLLTVEGTPEDMGIAYGWILKTASGESYAMRHEENIWRGELAWSTGFVTSEPHGNTLTYEDFVGLMGDTITEMVMITENGYYNVSASAYVPVKFDGSAKVEDADIKKGTTAVTTTGFPADYKMKYSVEGLNASVAEGVLTYTDAVPGTYTLTVSDESGVYADVPVTFNLTTADMPAAFDGTGKLVKAENATDEEFANFLANLSTASVNGTEYKVSGRKSVKMFGADGTIDFNVTSGGNNVFDGSGNYKMTVNAAGYTTPLEFTITAAQAEVTTTAAATESTTTKTTTTAKKSTTTTNKATTKKAASTDSPKTGVAGTAIPAVMLALAGAAAVIFRKKND